MVQFDKIKNGILDLANKGVYDEAEMLLARYEKAVPNDPDIYNLKSIIYADRGNPTKALEILKAGVEKHPLDFDIQYNLAYLHEQLGQYLKAFDRYIAASNITTQEVHHKDIATALARLQELIKVQVEGAKSGALQVQDVPTGLDASRETTVVEVELEKCRDNFAFGYGEKAWHPFVETIRELAENPEIKYGDCTLAQFFFLLIQSTGYHPGAGYLLKAENDYRFVVCEGYHHVAALAALGFLKSAVKCSQKRFCPV